MARRCPISKSSSAKFEDTHAARLSFLVGGGSLATVTIISTARKSISWLSRRGTFGLLERRILISPPQLISCNRKLRTLFGLRITAPLHRSCTFEKYPSTGNDHLLSGCMFSPYWRTVLSKHSTSSDPARFLPVLQGERQRTTRQLYHVHGHRRR